MAENIQTTPTLEQEIAALEKQIQEKKATLQTGAEVVPSEKEAVKEAIGERIQKQPPQYQPAPAAPTPATPPLSAAGTPSYLTPELRETVQQLVNVAFTKSLEEAVKEAVKTNNAALIDAFHDVLADQLYSTLLERRKLNATK